MLARAPFLAVEVAWFMLSKTPRRAAAPARRAQAKAAQANVSTGAQSCRRHYPPPLVIGDPALEAAIWHGSSLRKLIIERGHFTRDEADVALGNCTIDQARLAQINVDPEIQEKVALWLIGELKRLREGERQIGTAPVLSGKTMSRLDIADLAMTMLETCEGRPGHNLVYLLQQLLDIDRHRKALAEIRSEKFDLAVRIDAQEYLKGRPQSALQLSRHLSVSPTTLITWRRLPEYHGKVESLIRCWRDRLREFLEEIRVGVPNLPEQQAFQRAFEMYEQDIAKRGDLEFYYWAKETLGSVTDAKVLKIIWNKQIVPWLDALTPSDRKAMLGLLRKNKGRLTR
jgi:hypothetical protein